MKEAVGDDAKLQAELLTMLVNINDVQEGLYWARKYEIAKEKWPWVIANAEKRYGQSNVSRI